MHNELCVSSLIVNFKNIALYVHLFIKEVCVLLEKKNILVQFYLHLTKNLYIFILKFEHINT